MKVLTIDPGIAGTGWAYWEKEELISTGIIKPSSHMPWESKSKFVMVKLKDIMAEKKPHAVYVELPESFGGARGMATSGGGSLVKLTLLVGAIMHEFMAIPVGIRAWKGQLPKHIVEKRVKELLPNCKATSHAMDAVGIGLYVQGRF